MEKYFPFGMIQIWSKISLLAMLERENLSRIFLPFGKILVQISHVFPFKYGQKLGLRPCFDLK
jgi:hypothetical protein